MKARAASRILLAPRTTRIDPGRPMHLRNLSSALALFALAACSGGGQDGPQFAYVTNGVADFFARFFVGGWRYPTRVLGIPLINFIAWFVFVFVFSLQFRWIESRRHWTEWRRTGVLWAIVLVDVPILALLLISPNL